MKVHNIHTIFDGYRFGRLIPAAILLTLVLIAADRPPMTSTGR